MRRINHITDIHSHIIPGADDGSRTEEKTRNMLSLAWQQGIRSIIATPHYIQVHNRFKAARILDLTDRVQKNSAGRTSRRTSFQPLISEIY